MKKTGILLFVAALILHPVVASAQLDKSSVNEAMAFSRTLPSPVATALGFSGKARTGDIAWASAMNAAMIPFSAEDVSVALSYQRWAPSSDLNSVIGGGVGARFGIVGVSLSGSARSGQAVSYEKIDESGFGHGVVTDQPKDWMVNAGAGVQLLDALSLGLDLRYMGSKNVFVDQPQTAFAVDFFVATRFNGVNLTAGIANIGTPVKSPSGFEYALPASIALAGGYENSFGAHGVGVWLDLDYFTAVKGFTAAVGAQYDWKDLLFVRGGYHYASSAACIPTFASAGIGVKFLGFALDFSYLALSPLGGTLTLGLTYSL